MSLKVRFQLLFDKLPGLLFLLPFLPLVHTPPLGGTFESKNVAKK